MAKVPNNMVPPILQEKSNISDKMVQLVSILYCRYVFQEFRRPVYISYPELADSYLTVISRPMDLGTLLLKLLESPDQLELSDFKEQLQLVYNNALKFNEGYPTLESVSSHLQKTTISLYEEIFHEPFGVKDYQLPVQTNNEIIVPEAVLIEEYVAKKRLARFTVLKDAPLNKTELSLIHQLLQEVSSNATSLLQTTTCSQTEDSGRLSEILNAFQLAIKTLEEQVIPVHTEQLAQLETFWKDEKTKEDVKKAKRKEAFEAVTNKGKDAKKSVKIVDPITSAGAAPSPSTNTPVKSHDESLTTSRTSPLPFANAVSDALAMEVSSNESKESEGEEKKQEELDITSFTPIPTIALQDILQQLFGTLLQALSSSSNPETLHQLAKLPLLQAYFPIFTSRVLATISTTTTTTSASPSCVVQFIEQFQTRLALLCVLIEERVFRGTTASFTWGVPYPVCYWSQLANYAKDSHHKQRAAWWPCMVLSAHPGSSGSSITQDPFAFHGMKEETMQRNVARLPLRLLKEVMKVRPRVTPVAASAANTNGEAASSDPQPPTTPGDALPSSLDMSPPASSKSKSSKSNNKKGNASAANNAASNAPFSCPEGYCLVEYFGDHELGWIKIDSLIPMLPTGVLPAVSATSSNVRFCSLTIFEEAEDARKTFWRQSITYNEPSFIPEYQDLSTLPTKEALSATISDVHIPKRSAAVSAHSNTTTSSTTTTSNSSSSNSGGTRSTTTNHNQANNGATSSSLTTRGKKPVYFLPTIASTGALTVTSATTTTTENDPNLLECIEITVSSSGRKKLLKINEVYDIQGYNLTTIPTPSKLVPRDYQRIPYHKYFVPNPLNKEFYDPQYPSASTVTYIVSSCPLPLPIEELNTDLNLPPQFSSTDPTSPVKSEEQQDGKEATGVVVNNNGVSKAKGLTFRRNALVRTRGFSLYMQHVKSLVFELSTSLPPIGMKGINWGLDLNLPVTNPMGANTTSTTVRSAQKRKYDEFSVVSGESENCNSAGVAREITFVSDPRGIDFSWGKVVVQ